jgi:hypothetical protein
VASRRRVEARALRADLVNELGADEGRQVLLDEHPLVVPGSGVASAVEDLALANALVAKAVDEPVVHTEYREVQLSHRHVDVVARVADQREPLGIARKIGLPAGVVATEQELVGSSHL